MKRRGKGEGRRGYWKGNKRKIERKRRGSVKGKLQDYEKRKERVKQNIRK